jgi:hypothetical protein
MTKAKAAKAKKTNGKSKTAQVIALARRAKGVTRKEVLAVTGWQAVNMNAIGVKIKIDKSEFPYRYRATGGEAMVYPATIFICGAVCSGCVAAVIMACLQINAADHF